jgi:hypothetical protein
MYAAILHLAFPAELHAEVSAFLVEEMGSVIRDNDGFVDFRVLDGGRRGELIIMDTWRHRDDSAAASQKPEAQAVHQRYTALGIEVVRADRYEVQTVSG